MKLVGCVLMSAPWLTQAQTATEREQGLRDATPRWHVLTEVRLVVAPGRVVENGMLVLKDGLVVAAGPAATPPEGARVWRLPGRTVYPGFIDLASSIGVPASLRPPAPEPPRWGRGSELPPPKAKPPEPRPLVGRALAASNPFVRPEQDVAQQLEWKAEDARDARALGFTAVLAAPAAGVFRGQGALLALGDAKDPKLLVIAPRAAQHTAFDIDRSREPGYPSSLMGSVALARQVLYDARWHRDRSASARADAERIAPNASLAGLAPVLEGRQTVIHATSDELDYPRAVALRDEFKLRMVLQGNGHEYRRAAQLKSAALPVIVPLTFPTTPDVTHPDRALDVPLDALQHWEQAPSNLAWLTSAGVPVAVTAAGLKDAGKEFWPRLRQAVRRGLPAQQALAALTTQPASFIGQSARLGSLEPGRIANVVVARGDLFTEDDAAVELVFVDGRPLPNDAFRPSDPRGTWAVDGGSATLVIAGTRSAPKLEQDGVACELAAQGAAWVLRLPCTRPADSAPRATVVAELRDDRLAGTVQDAGGTLKAWSARRVAPAAAPAASAAEPAVAGPPATYPAGAFGVAVAAARPALLLVRNATVWAMGGAGKLERADLLVRDGKVSAIGTALSAPSGAEVIDATGKHVTPGLIDAHSHITMNGGYNEQSHSVTAEVRVGDIVDPTDINIYRQLAGGLTVAHVLHGSSNTIGGQSQLIKLRWGSDAPGLAFEGAAPTIKFALGENVKGSNWGPGTRYPATRMGVEQVLRDAFAGAREYAREQRAWRTGPRRGPEPRRDLQLEALSEVLDGTRLVHIHSYRADEILMFARLAKELGITVGAFQHVLEGYKVADAIAGIGAGGSTFSDWWGYKMEVQDAIPGNAALMHRAGVLVSINSDDAELARRLNSEAAKAMKYGGLSELEALALVTINPARQLRIDRRVGSLEPGKDADFVIWSGHPLSNYSRAEQTWIDGRRHFDLDSDRRLRAAAARERLRLVELALRAPPPPRGDAPPPKEAGDAPRPVIAAHALGELPWRQWLDRAHALRPAYADLPAWHECTEHAP
ncbi:amidohydrolase family protein [uncultured Piscinibacter sp.]|uniref:amidohydrolase family protein n=1 Tax=uncultured Piscinibacter sp. TaxID=1131835 RepID=UPI002629372F|nr:amidohydrolase family protein [uncultured Piscinibacter sp.]